MIKGKRLIIISLGVTLLATLMPMNGDMAGHYFDKVVHFLLYFILGTSLILTYGKKEKGLQLLILAALMGLIIEAIQQYIPGRNASIPDGISNTLGLVVAMFLSRSRRFSSMKILVKLKEWN